MRIAICDDDSRTCQELEKILRKVVNLEIDIEIYEKGEELLRDFSKGARFEILYLDIEMPGLTGIQVGEMLREKVNRRELDLMFISRKTSYCMQLFDLEPRNFYPKPFNEEKIISDLRRILQERRTYRTSILGEADGIEYCLLLKDIRYFEALNREVKAFDNNKGEYVLKKTLKELEKILAQEGFLRCHKSYLLNLDYVKGYGGTFFALDNCEQIPIGRKYNKLSRETWNMRKLGED